MSVCANKLVCACEGPVFPVPLPVPPGRQLSGLLWTLPCTAATSNPGVCACVAGSNVSTVLNGPSDLLFTVTLRIRGVNEYAPYVGGSIVPGTGNRCVLGGAGTSPILDRYSLSVSNPAQLYWLNATTGGDDTTIVHLTDFSFSLQMYGGATISLIADSLDSFELSNLAGLIVPVSSGGPSIGVAQPYPGQFLQMDPTSITF